MEQVGEGDGPDPRQVADAAAEGAEPERVAARRERCRRDQPEAEEEQEADRGRRPEPAATGPPSTMATTVVIRTPGHSRA